MAQNFSTAEYGTGAASATGLSTSTTQKHSGTQSYVVSSGATDQFASYTMAGTGSPAIRAYVYVTSFTANLYRNHLLWITNASSNGLIGFKINASQQITLVAGNSNASLTTLATGTQTFPLNTWVRLEIKTSGTTSYTAAWYANDSATAAETFTGTSSVTINGGTYYTIGAPYQMGGYAAAGYWDDLASNSTGELMGPATAILTNNWESMTNGQTLDTPPTGNNGNTPIAGYNGTFGGVAANTYAHSGTLSLRQPIGTTQSWTIANVQTGVAAARSYFYFGSTVTNTDLYFMQLLQGANTTLTVALSIAGSYQQDGFVLLGGLSQNVLLSATTQGFAANYLNQWLRFEVSYVQSSGAWSFAIYQNDSTSAIYSATGTSTNNMPASGPDRVAIGKLQNNGASGTVTSYWTDDVAFTTASANAIGPVPSGLTNIQSSQSSTWATYSSVSSSRATAWSVNATITSSQSSTWGTGGSLVVSQPSNWNTLINTSKQQDTFWAIQATINSPRSSTWGVAGSTSNSQSDAYAVAAQVINSTSSTYAVVQRITSSATSAYTVNAQVTGSSTSTWNTATAVTSSAQSAWSVRAFVQADRASSYTVLYVVPQSRESFWSVNTTVTSSQLSAFSVASSVTSSQSSTYAVNTVVTRDQATSWEAEVGAASSVVSTYGTLTSLNTALTSNFDTKVAVNLNQPAIYDVRSQVLSDQSATWSSVSRVNADVTSTWDTQKYGIIKVYSNTPSTFDTRQQIVGKQTDAWNVLTTLTVPVTTQWSDLLAVIPQQAVSKWGVAGITGSHIDSVWATRRRARHRQSVGWNVLGPADVIPVVGTIAKSKVIAFAPENKPVVKTSKQSVKVTVQQTIRIGEL